MQKVTTLISQTIPIILSIFCGLADAQPLNIELKHREIIFETNSSYQDLTSTSKKVFVSYILPATLTTGEFFVKRRMIVEEFMAGVNFPVDSAVLTLEQYWNGVKVQQCVISPTLQGAPAFSANQNRPLLIRTQIRREAGPLSASTIRNHSYWQTDFEETTFFGKGDEFAWGNISVDLSQDVLVEWKYFWSVGNCFFYFDHLKVDY
jgi:hypothetical protein